MKNELKIKLESYFKIANIHELRLSKSIEKLKKEYPFSKAFIKTISDENFGYLEIMSSRLAKLQDVIGKNIFPLILRLEKEEIDNLSFLDRLNLLEKLGILDSKNKWLELRDIRNSISHEYPDDEDLMIENLNKIFIFFNIKCS